MNVNTDAILLKALSLGDEDAFDAVFIEYFPKLKRFIRGFVNRDEDAENIAQNIFMTLWIRRETLINVMDLNSYLFTMSKNAAYHHFQDSMKIKSIPIDEKFDLSEAVSLEDTVLAEELNKLILDAVNEMPEQRKKVFMMSRIDDLPNEEIARRLNISKRTVETHISAALSQLRKILPMMILMLFYKF
jgi:RNA polymerase sigma-70 factor (family 1)